MRAVVKFRDGKDGWEVREVPRPDPKPGEVEIAVKAAGICGSDLHLYHDNHAYTAPVVGGHEFSGVISRVGEGVCGWRAGDRVICEGSKHVCGECEFCRTGRSALCVKKQGIGFMRDGGMAEYYCTPANLLFCIPDHVSSLQAAMVEPCAVAVNAVVLRQPVRPGDVVVVQGCGTIGLMVAMVAKAAGAARVIITGKHGDAAKRFPAALGAGVNRAVDVEREDLRQAVMDMTDGLGADMVVDATGSPAALYAMADIVKKNGRIVGIGETAAPAVKIRWNDLIFRSCSITFTFGLTYPAWKIALGMIADGKVDVRPLLTHTLPLEDFRQGFELMETKQAFKVLLLP